MTSREQFETAWQKNNECEPMDGWESLRCDDGYTDEIIDGQWWAWQASREAVVVVLPPAINTEEIGVAISKERTMARLAFAGVKVKGE
ncbi:hypothetical protein [Hafnia alvei]|uniref:Uncharacterized protein n=2 Tax=Hafnia alvei TaxID=569 RepID=A0A377PMY4_HAFAL|nr:hypothetical protein [Hafnia alvei]KFC86043.1 hypothetical protein GHAL_3729 [Hafnia alvei ATCC 13337]RLR09717.1 hypothetical protein EAE69_12400 [Hafnia alvei ATCC 13337]WQD24140.1 hypothetical protein U0008_15140 [Hafnia alvei]STQ81331.1 Uncharacterised protein [Hafnia alvei]